MFPEQHRPKDLAPKKEAEKRLPSSWALAIETDKGVVGLYSDPWQLALSYPKHNDIVLGSISEHVRRSLGRQLYIENHPKSNLEHLTPEVAKAQLTYPTDSDLSALIKQEIRTAA